MTYTNIYKAYKSLVIHSVLCGRVGYSVGCVLLYRHLNVMQICECALPPCCLTFLHLLLLLVQFVTSCLGDRQRRQTNACLIICDGGQKHKDPKKRQTLTNVCMKKVKHSSFKILGIVKRRATLRLFLIFDFCNCSVPKKLEV